MRYNNRNVTVSDSVLCHPYCCYVHLLFFFSSRLSDQVQQGPKHNEEHQRLSTPSQVPAPLYKYTDTDCNPVSRGFIFCEDVMISKKRCKHLHEDRDKGLPCACPSSLVPICLALPRVLTSRLRAVSQIRRVINSLTAETRRMGFYECALNTPHDNNSLLCSPYPEPYHEPGFLKIMRRSFLRRV